MKAIAVPLSLLFDGTTTLSARPRYARKGMVDFRGAVPAALSALTAAPGLVGCHHHGQGPGGDTALRWFCLPAMLPAGLVLLVAPAWCRLPEKEPPA